MLIQMLRHSSQRVKPYLSRYNFFVSLQRWHLPVFVPRTKIFFGLAADLLFFASCVSSHLCLLLGSVLLGCYRRSGVLRDHWRILAVSCTILLS